ncbi:carbohydrate ABC transporter permease [Paenibacillus hemerocallicola]|uniref:Carbohydrate ABC transporter permease n=1 Tax=Paenibacillus hemerocallicola TaxID=1172614 RepID=A0A5C4TD07_9BACL|nr:carbohydrate ABC transporter permease [Paenibacillus hemerocallicola]
MVRKGGYTLYGIWREDKLFNLSITIVLSFVALIVLYPLFFIIIASISNPQSVVTGEVLLMPKGVHFAGYEKILKNTELQRGFINTVFYTVTGTAINLVLTICAAYPLSRKDFKGRQTITAFLLFTMFFSGGMIPTYLLIRDLGMINTIWAMLLPNAVSVVNVIIMRTYFQTTIPAEVQEAASIDGCSNLKLLWRVVLPLSMPIVAVMILFYSVAHWNAYFNAMLYLNNRTMYPLQLLLREILVQNDLQDMVSLGDDSLMKQLLNAESVKYAAVIAANLPVLLLYPFLQKYFVKGIFIGAIKG